MKCFARWFAVALGCCLLGAAPAAAGWTDGTPGAPWWEFDQRTPGGVLIIHRPGRTITSMGGVLLPRRVTVRQTGALPARIKYPSAFHAPTSLLAPGDTHGIVSVEIPDERGLLYIGDDPTPLRGAAHVLRSPPMAPGEIATYRFRAVFREGDQLLVQDRAVAVEAGRAIYVTFDTAGAARVALPAEAAPAE